MKKCLFSLDRTICEDSIILVQIQLFISIFFRLNITILCNTDANNTNALF